MRSKDGIARHLSAANACITKVLAKQGVQASGKIDVRAKITVRGQLKEISARGLPAADACLIEAFKPARLPPPDTGAGSIAFVLAYETKR